MSIEKAELDSAAQQDIRRTEYTVEPGRLVVTTLVAPPFVIVDTTVLYAMLVE